MHPLRFASWLLPALGAFALTAACSSGADDAPPFESVCDDAGPGCGGAGGAGPCAGGTCGSGGSTTTGGGGASQAGASSCTGASCGGTAGSAACAAAGCGGGGGSGGGLDASVGGCDGGSCGGDGGTVSCDGGACSDAAAPGGCGPATCPDGCCDDVLGCVGASGQSDTLCGGDGESCRSCALVGETCHATAHVCTSPFAHDAEILSHDMPLSLAAGESVTVTVVARNTGTATWTATDSYKLGSQAPQDNTTWGTGRWELAPSDSVGTGADETFTLQLTAPATPGVYGFQVRMVQEAVEWFGDYSVFQPVFVGSPSVTVCEAARALVDTDTDATATIQTCIDATAAGEILELPAGTYRIDGKLTIQTNGITLRTEGKDPTMAPCATVNHDCAELSASTSFADTVGILQLLVAGSHVDHLVINGNKTARAGTASGSQCAGGSNAYGYNMRVMCSSCVVTNSVSKNTLCGTAMEVSGVGSDVIVWRNSFVDNGVHDTQGLWSDGVTVHDYATSAFVANEFRDGTDIDFIFGGCQGCVIQDNTITHTDAFAGGAFASLMLHAWPSGATSGNFTGTDTSRNHIDCGASRRCGFGLYIGPDAWYDADTYGGAVHDNLIERAQQGVLIDDAHDMAVFNNRVVDPGSSTTASCGSRSTGAYGIGTTSANIDTSRDTLGTTYDAVDWDGCIPNWWQP